jgi:hypothetical protein
MTTTTATAPAPFTFDRDYSNFAQITPYYPAFTARMAELEAAGRYPYNAEFKGHLGVEDDKAEDTAIYLCQTLTHIHDDALKVNAFIAEGGRFITADDKPTGRVDVAMFGWYSGGSGFRVHRDVRLVYRPGAALPYALLPKGRRTNGFAIEGVALVKESGE